MTDIIARTPSIVAQDRTTIRQAQTIPGLPKIEFDPIGAGERGARLKVGPFDFRAFQQQETQLMAPQANGALPMIGPFGVQPGVKEVAVRVCPTGMRLGIDGLCYPKQLLAARSKLRAWPSEMKPPVTNADRRALNKIDSVRTKLKKMGKKADLRVTNK